MLRNYALPLLLALLLHAGVAAALTVSWDNGAEEARSVQPRIIHAKVLVMEPAKAAPAAKPKPAAKPPPAPKPPAPKPRPKPAPKPDAAPKPAPRDPPAERRAREEAERRAREEAERAERLREMLARSTALALQDETIAQDDGGAAAATMTYSDAIAQAIVREWSRPPSARNDMEARMVVELTPAGDLLGVEIADSSGNAAFDRAAEAAVRKAARRERFPVPPERSLFEAQFRRFTLLFKPEDLLR